MIPYCDHGRPADMCMVCDPFAPLGADQCAICGAEAVTTTTVDYCYAHGWDREDIPVCRDCLEGRDARQERAS